MTEYYNRYLEKKALQEEKHRRMHNLQDTLFTISLAISVFLLAFFALLIVIGLFVRIIT